MIKYFFLILLILTQGYLSAQATYFIHKTPTPIPMNGLLSDWDEFYYIDSINSDTNLYCRTSTIPWTPDKISAKLYMAWDDSMVYFAVQITHDDDPLNPTVQHDFNYGYDFLEISVAGVNSKFILHALGGEFNPHGLFTLGEDIFVEVGENNGYPFYEWKIKKSIIPDSQRININIYDVSNSDWDTVYAPIFGANYELEICNFASSTWRDPAGLPRIVFVDTVRPSIEIRETIDNSNKLFLNIHPNPFSSDIMLTFMGHMSYPVLLEVVDLKGSVLNRQTIMTKNKALRLDVPAGIYFLRAISGNSTISRKILKL